MATPDSAPEAGDPIVNVLAGVIRDQQAFMRDVLVQMTAVCTLALGPIRADEVPGGGREQATAADYAVPDIDPTDPNEVYLGVDFMRETSAVYDATDEAPFGLPGIKDESPDLLARP